VPTPDDDDALIERFVPIIRFTAGEYFLPMSIDTYLARCELRRQVAGRTEVLASSGQVDRNTLVQLAGTASGCSLAYVTEPATRTATAVWRLDDERPRFRAANRLGTVGVMSRLIDSALRFSLLVRGRVASGTEAAAELAYRPERVAADHWCYARLLRQDGYTVLQYWFFYAFNDWRSRASGVNDHEADWEQVTVFLTESADGAQPRWVAFSSHDYQGDDLRRRWDDPDLTTEGDRPVVFAGLGSHSGAYLAGDYLMIVDKGTLGRLFAVGRRLTRLLLPWTRDVERDGLGAPYIDYARGDGEVVGGTERPLRCERIDDSTPWVDGYTGLWGVDTSDPLGGERGPAGPRYERNGKVRMSWHDPVGWTGLSKVPPDAVDARRAIERRLQDLDSLLVEAQDRRASILTRMRAMTTVGERPPVTLVEESERIAAEAIALADERRRLLSGPEDVAAGPHDHLRRRQVPVELDTTTRARVLAGWAIVSTPLLLASLALMFLSSGTGLVLLGGGALLLVFMLEAIARRHLAEFIFTAAWVTLTVFVLAIIVAGLVTRWRLTVGAVFVTAAAVVLVLNVRELRRR
jgi:hypothetical protein